MVLPFASMDRIPVLNSAFVDGLSNVTFEDGLLGDIWPKPESALAVGA